MEKLSEIALGKLKLVAFDLDDTLAPSKSPLPPEMASALRALLDRYQVCVISGGQLGQFQTQLLDNLQAQPHQLSRLHLMPTCGTHYLRFSPKTGEICEVYRENLAPELRKKVIHLLQKKARELGLWEAHTWGEIIEDRGSQVTFSALGQAAPLEAKRAWDPTGEKKNLLRQAVAAEIPELEVRSGGSTSIDITRKGIDKGYGMRQLQTELDLDPTQILFIGDRLDPQGNDYPVIATGIPCLPVVGWEHTVRVINELLECS